MSTAAIVRTCEKTNIWLNELAQDLDWDDRDMVFRALRVVLHQLRDRLPLNESVQLASQLPMLIRGCYYENWVPKNQPSHIKAESFVSEVGFAFPGDSTVDPDQITKAVFRLIARHVSKGEIADVIACLPKDYRPLWPESS